MLYSKTSFAVIHGASQDETRPALCGINLDPTGATIACDGHVLFLVSPSHQDAQDFPPIEGIEPQRATGEILPTSTAKEILKAIPTNKQAKYLPVLQNAALVFKSGSNGKLRFITTDLTNTREHVCRPIDPPYPDWRRVLPQQEKWLALERTTDCMGWLCIIRTVEPQEKPVFSISLNLEVLERLIKFVKAARKDTITENVRIDFDFFGPQSPAMFHAGTNWDSNQQVSGLIMPMRKQ